MRGMVLISVSLIVGGCASVVRPTCPAGETASISDTLYFGMAKPTGGLVSAEEWSDFLRTVVTPRFPAGLTAWPASGQWRGNDGQVVREDSHVLNLLHPPDGASETSVKQIAEEYKSRFAQEAVLRVRAPVCISL